METDQDSSKGVETESLATWLEIVLSVDTDCDKRSLKFKKMSTPGLAYKTLTLKSNILIPDFNVILSILGVQVATICQR